jgi:hypothetical protein
MLAANGVTAPIELSLAVQVADALVAMRRAIPYPKWSDEPGRDDVSWMDSIY